MKKWKKTWTLILCAVVAYLIIMGSGTMTFAEETVTPPFISGTEGISSAGTWQYQITKEHSMLAVPVQISRAGLAVFEVTPNTSATAVHMVLSSSASAQDDSAWISINSAGSHETAKLQGYAKGVCTWYLHLFTAVNDAADASITIKSYQKAAVTGNGTLKKGKWVDYYADGGNTSYYKIKVPASGLLKFEIVPEGKVSMWQADLLNSKKKSLSSTESAYIEKETCYGVKKGTYYIRLLNDSREGETCRMRYTFEQVKTTKNTKKAKAITLKKGKTAKGLFLHGDRSDERWYKVTVPKNQKVKLNISIKNNNNSQLLFIYRANMKSVKDITLKNGKNKKSVKLKKGTYYFVLMDGSDSGSYSIQWK